MHRSHELGRAVAPAHPLGDRQSRQRLAENIRQQVGRIHALDRLANGHPSALVGFQRHQLIGRRIAAAQETFQRLAGRTIRLKGGIGSRTAALDLLIRLRELQALDDQRQTARCRIRMDFCKGEAKLRQPGFNLALQRPTERQQGFGG